MPEARPNLIAERYRLVGQIGQGGMGRVWAARDELLGRDVAIKELVPAPGLTGDELGALRERTIREARAIAMLDHPNVVRIFDVVFDRGEPWIVMELVPSRSLFDTVRDDGPMSPDRAARVGLGVLAALRAAHRTGLLHRDVKPGNVLLAHDGRVVLTDFGLATAAGDASMTSTGVVLGSPQYLAPERALDGEIGPPADLWSLGATLYAAVEGRPPYVRSSPMATLAALATELPAPPERAGALRHALTALLQRDPALRADAETAQHLLLAATSANAAPPPELPRYEHPTFAVPHQRTPAPVLPPTPQPRPSAPAAQSGPAAAVRGGPGASAAPGVSGSSGEGVGPGVSNGRRAGAGVGHGGGPGAGEVDPLAVLDPSPRKPVDPLAVLAPAPHESARSGVRPENPPGSAGPHRIARQGTAVQPIVSRRAATSGGTAGPGGALAENGAADTFGSRGSADASGRSGAADASGGSGSTVAPQRKRRVLLVAAAVVVLVTGGLVAYPLISGARTADPQPDAAFVAPSAGEAGGAGTPIASVPVKTSRPRSPGPSGSHSVSGSPSAKPSKPGASAQPGASPTAATTTGAAVAGRRFRGHATGTCLYAPGTTGRIQSWACNDDAGQKFTHPADGTLRVRGKCVQVAGTGDGATLDLATCTGARAQQWNYNASYDLVNLWAIKCVDIPDASGSNGVVVQIWECNGGSHQKWDY
ncbi:protein kinase domain-containing protein [Actinoplanes philippinensis]|uniref:protein kinase domain-containing protein n=1 Tax=Actinoplanes philippinensis TaxID=35752 RepID=UPI0033F5FE68